MKRFEAVQKACANTSSKEIVETAIKILRNRGATKGIISTYSDDDFSIFYSEWNDVITIHHKNNLVLWADEKGVEERRQILSMGEEKKAWEELFLKISTEKGGKKRAKKSSE